MKNLAKRIVLFVNRLLNKRKLQFEAPSHRHVTKGSTTYAPCMLSREVADRLYYKHHFGHILAPFTFEFSRKITPKRILLPFIKYDFQLGLDYSFEGKKTRNGPWTNIAKKNVDMTFLYCLIKFVGRDYRKYQIWEFDNEYESMRGSIARIAKLVPKEFRKEEEKDPIADDLPIIMQETGKEYYIGQLHSK